MAGGTREVLSGIATVSDMVVAFQDEDRCRRLLEAMVWPRGRICPACGYRLSIALAGRDLGRASTPWPVSVFKCRVQIAVHGDHADTAAFDQASTAGLADRPMADPPIRQGNFLGAPGRSSRGQPAHRLAHRPCVTAADDPRAAIRWHG